MRWYSKLTGRKFEFDTLFREKGRLDIVSDSVPQNLSILQETPLTKAKNRLKSFYRWRECIAEPRLLRRHFFSGLSNYAYSGPQLHATVSFLSKLHYLFETRSHYVFLCLDQHVPENLDGMSGAPVFSAEERELVGVFGQDRQFSIIFTVDVHGKDFVFSQISKYF